MSTSPLPTSQPPIQTVSRRQIHFVEGLGLFLTALGLISLIGLWPRPTPSASLPTNQNDQLSSSGFTITNDGYARLTDVKAVCFLWRVQLNQIAHIDNDLSRIVSPSEGTLQTSEGITVPCTARSPIGFASGPPRLTKADLAIAVYYRPWPITILRCHRLFRFVARIGSNGDVVAWDKQPSAILEQDFDKAMASGQPII
jgi:hypothetical protein